MEVNKVHEDKRGQVYSIGLPDNKELILFFSRAGYLRGGHSHDVNEASPTWA